MADSQARWVNSVLVTDTMPVDAILGLVAGAVSVTESQAPGFRSYDINDQGKPCHWLSRRGHG